VAYLRVFSIDRDSPSGVFRCDDVGDHACLVTIAQRSRAEQNGDPHARNEYVTKLLDGLRIITRVVLLPEVLVAGSYVAVETSAEAGKTR
jgi:hypothetical protein